MNYAHIDTWPNPSPLCCLCGKYVILTISDVLTMFYNLYQ